MLFADEGCGFRRGGAYGGVSDEGDAPACKNTVLRGRRNRDADGGCSAFFSTVAAEKMRNSEKFP